MKKILLMVLVGGMLMACHSDIDLNNVDTTAEVNMGVAVPVGSVRAKLGDFIGNIPGMYINSEGVLALRFPFQDDSRDFHKFDIRKHISSQEDTLNVYQKLDALGLIGPGGVIKGTGMGFDIPATLHFDFPIKLKDINKEIGRERLDSALIDNARFVSQFWRENLPLEWEWIDEMDLVLGDQVYRPAGNSKVIYRRGDVGGDNIPFTTDIENFSISLMKNKNLSIENNNISQYDTNVDSVFTFGVDFKITIPKSAGAVTLSPTAKFNYSMQVEFIDYSAIWGYFQPDKDMISKKVEVDMDTILGSLTMFDRLSTPFTDPKIDVAVTTEIAGAMILTGNYVYVTDQNGDSTFALFDNHRYLEFQMDPWMHPDPKKSTIGASVTDTVHFSKENKEGRIDRLFSKIPKKLGYDFYVNINSMKSPQVRITPNTEVKINAICDLPLKFRDGLFVDYRDTVREVNLTAVDIDSLVHESEIIDSIHAGEVTLFLTVTNNIPVGLKAVFCYLDKNNQPIKDPTDPSKLFNPFAEDTIRIVSPRFEKSTSNIWTQVEDGKNVLTAHMNKEQLAVVPDIKKIAYKVMVDNEALHNAFQASPGLQEIRLTPDQTLEFQIGLTAQIDAVLKLSRKQ